METEVGVVCGMVAILGILSAISGFLAESNRVKASQVYISYDYGYPECVNPSNPASDLGGAAAVALLLGRILISVSGGGCACCKRDPKSKCPPIVGLCSVLSWMTSIVAGFLLIGGAAVNNWKTMVTTGGVEECSVVKAGVFAGGAQLSLASLILGIDYYMTLSSSIGKASSDPFDGPQAGTKDVEKPPMPPQKY